MNNAIFKKIENNIILALLSMIYAFLYSWIYIIPNTIVYEYSILYYLSADILFEIILAVSSFISVLWLYKPLSNLFDKMTFINIQN